MGEAVSDTSGGGRQTLRQILVARYDSLIQKLTRRLGSADLADDALHDAWLRLESAPEPSDVRDPFAYILRVAANLGTDRRRKDQRRAAILGLQHDHIEADDIADEAPDPERVAAARSEWDTLKGALISLPSRRQAIFLAAFVEEVAYDEIARRHGVTVRTIQTEVKRALEHCVQELGRK